MRCRIAVCAAVGLVWACSLPLPGAAGEEKKPPVDPLPNTLSERASYAIGLNFGKQLKKAGNSIKIKTLFRGIRDGRSDNKALMTEKEIRTALTAFQRQLMEREAADNLEKGQAFLQSNAKSEGVVTTKSGLQYRILKKGEGAKGEGASPKLADSVVAHYRGTLIDGTEFDSSYKRGKPATFPLRGVIKGWTEALQLMKVGAKWKLYVPHNLAYGSRPQGRVIGPNSTLIFDVELLSIRQGGAP
jgi:FKBP-type peptidyl-prolyl cis-trans isomerase FklB